MQLKKKTTEGAEERNVLCVASVQNSKATAKSKLFPVPSFFL